MIDEQILCTEMGCFIQLQGIYTAGVSTVGDLCIRWHGKPLHFCETGMLIWDPLLLLYKWEDWGIHSMTEWCFYIEKI